MKIKLLLAALLLPLVCQAQIYPPSGGNDPRLITTGTGTTPDQLQLTGGNIAVSSGTGALDLSGFTLTLPTITITFRHGTYSALQATVLNANEPGWTTDTHDLYMGDGVTAGGLRITPMHSIIGTGIVSNDLPALSTGGLAGTGLLFNEPNLSGNPQDYYALTIPVVLSSGSGWITPYSFAYGQSGTGAHPGTRQANLQTPPNYGWFQLVGGQGGNSTSTGTGGNAGAVTFTNGFVQFISGNGGNSTGAGNGGAGASLANSTFQVQAGNGGTASSTGTGGAGGGFGNTWPGPVEIIGGSGGSSTGAGKGGAGGIIANANTAQSTNGGTIVIQGGPGGSTVTGTGGAGGSTDSFNLQGGAGASGATGHIGGNGGNSGYIESIGGDGDVATTSANGGNGGNGGNVVLDGGAASGTFSGGAAGTLNLSGGGSGGSAVGYAGGSVNLAGGVTGAGAIVTGTNGNNQYQITVYSGTTANNYIIVGGTSAAPTNTVTPVAWRAVIINSSTYKEPLYQ